MQIAAETSKKLNASKNADIETSIDNLQIAERSQPQQTPSYKIGGGGARAARRIRIRRPRLAERGAKACQTFTQTSADSKASSGPRPTCRPHPELRLFQPLGPQISDFGRLLQISDRLFADRKYIKNQIGFFMDF